MPLSEDCKLTIPSGLHLQFSPQTIAAKNKIIEAKAFDNIGSFAPILTLGQSLTAGNFPLMVKSMKKRTLTVSVHPVALKKANAAAIYPARIPSNSQADRDDFDQKLTEYLDEVYGRQVNLFFDINVMSAVEVDFDTVAPIGITAITSGQDFTPEMSIACTNPQWPLKLANIDIWILGGTQLMEGPQSYAGMKIGGVIEEDVNRQTPYIIIDGSDSVGRIIAHEMGHIFMNGGHPDLKQDGHFARLEGGSDVPRLMKSKGGSHTECQLVKKEWDKIEAWLKLEELNGRISQ